MSFEIPEQAKYRLTGGIVLIVVAIFVVPGLMKKSNQRFEENMSLHVQVPPKPNAPRLNIPTAQQVFKKLKPVEVQAPQVAQRDVSLNLSKAQHLSYASYIPHIPAEQKRVVKNEVSVVKADLESKHYGVQLASFAHPENADFLIKRLKKQGYVAQYFELPGKNGTLYQVIVGKLSDKQQAIALQKKLSQNLQLQGMVVSKG